MVGYALSPSELYFLSFFGLFKGKNVELLGLYPIPHTSWRTYGDRYALPDFKCLRRWSNIVKMLYKCFVFTGIVDNDVLDSTLIISAFIISIHCYLSAISGSRVAPDTPSFVHSHYFYNLFKKRLLYRFHCFRIIHQTHQPALMLAFLLLLEK